MISMKLEPKSYSLMEEYVCDLTRKLDKLAGLNQLWKHYLLADEYTTFIRAIAIRVPGGTVGTLYLSDGFVIEKICIDREYIVKTYPEDVEEQLKEFIGQKIEIMRL